jgi:peptide/nickel transport system substrate-binding protein
MSRVLVMLAALMSLFTLVVNAQNVPDENTLVIAQSADISTLEVFTQSSRPESNIFGHVFATLLDVNESGEFVMYAAESMEVSEDGTAYTFTIKQGLTCHDGSPITADDVAFSFERANMLNADGSKVFTGHQAGYVMQSLGYAGVSVDDEYTVTVSLAGPQPTAPGLLADVYILCREVYGEMSLEDAAVTLVGSGPYRFVEWVPDDYVLIEKVEGFPLLEATFDRIIWRVIPEGSTRVAELLAGNVDIISNLPPDQLQAVNDSGAASGIVVAGTRRIYIGFSFRDVWDDTEGGMAIKNTDVRVALQYAIDIPTICQTLLNFECERATGLVNPPNNNPNLEPYPYDPALAEELLDAAGYPRGEDGVRFEITLQGPRGRYVNDANVVLAIGQYLTDIGVQTNVEIIEWAEYVPLIRAHDAGPMFLLGSGGVTWSGISDMNDLRLPGGDPDNFAATNYTEWANPDWFSRWPELLSAPEGEARQAVANEMLEVFYNDPPWLLMYFQPDFYGVSSRLNWTPRRDEVIDVTRATLN